MAETPKRRLTVPRNPVSVARHLKGMSMESMLNTPEGKKALKKMGIRQNGVLTSLMSKVEIPNISPTVIEESMRTGNKEKLMEHIMSQESFQTITQKLVEAMTSANVSIDEFEKELSGVPELQSFFVAFKNSPHRPILFAADYALGIADQCRTFLSTDMSDPTLCLWCPDFDRSGKRSSHCDMYVLPSFLGQLKREMFETDDDFENVKRHYDMLGMKSRTNTSCILRSGTVFMIASSVSKRPIFCVSASQSSAFSRSISVGTSFARTFNWKTITVYMKCAQQDVNPVNWEETLPQVRHNLAHSTMNSSHTVFGSISEAFTNICFAVYP